MVRERRNRLVLGALLILLAIVVARRVWPLWAPPTSDGAQASNNGGTARGRGSQPAITAPDVRLEDLDAERPQPGDVYRNLFRFKPKAAPPAPAPAVEDQPPSIAMPPPMPSGPAPPPPIPLKFIGFWRRQASERKVAMLTDGRGVYYGGEGDIIEGRYRILKIDDESLQMAHLDGRGRQTIRLTGQ